MFTSAPVLALITALCIGSADFSSHYALRHVRALPGTFFSISFQLFTLLVILLIRGKWDVGDWRGPAFFILVGILHPGIFFLFLLMAIDRLGPARAITLKGTSPFFGVAIAIIFLGERPNFPIYLGLFLVAGGVMYLTSERGSGIRLSRNLALPLIAAFFGGLAPNLAKVALGYMNDAPMGAACVVFGGLVAMFLCNTLLAGKVDGKFWLRATASRAVFLFAPMGMLGAFGFITYFTALKFGSVAVVIPLVQTAPFVAVLLSRVLIQEQERVNLQLLVSVVSIVLGAVLITMGRA
ncbi:MAG: DMT family transporter [Nitrospinota bacterium]